MKKVLPIVFLLFIAVPLFAGEHSTTLYIKQGVDQLKSGKYQTAIKTFEAATRLDPACAEAYEGIGEAYLGMGDNAFSSDPELIEKGINNLKITMKLNPKMAVAHYKLATAYLALNDKEKALKEYEILKGIDKEKASRLSAQISKYKAADKFQFIGSSVGSGGNRSSNMLHKDTGAPEPASTSKKKVSFTGTVELFVTSWCPSCKRAIAYMKEKGIPYVAYDVESDAQAKKRFDDLGGRGYPLILVGNNKFYGSDPKTIDYYTGR